MGVNSTTPGKEIMYEIYDMNDSVRHTITARAAVLEFAPDVLAAVNMAAATAERRTPDASRDANLLEQVCGLMSDELLQTEPVHLARYEIYASPQTVAYAFLASACTDFFEDMPDFISPEHNSTLESYEKSETGPDHETDFVLLQTAADLIAEELDAA